MVTVFRNGKEDSVERFPTKAEAEAWARHRELQAFPTGWVISVEVSEESKPCPKCGKEMAQQVGAVGVLVSPDDLVYACLKVFGGCGHEEKIKPSSARNNGMPDEGLNPSSGH